MAARRLITGVAAILLLFTAGVPAEVTADAGWRRGKALPLKKTVDEALSKSPTVEKCLVLNRVNEDVNMQEGRDFWWHELDRAEASEDCPADTAR